MLQKYLNVKKVKLAIIMAAVLFCCLFSGTGYVFAVDYTVYGQVFYVSSKDAADTTIPDASLTGTKLPYVHVAVYNRANGALLGEGDAGKNGQYNIVFTGTAALNIECRVSRVVDGASSLFQEARAGINSFNSISAYCQKKLIVISDSPYEYNDKGFCTTPGVGIVFTRVGLVEIPYITQTPTSPTAGLADFVSVTGGVARAAEVGVPAFEKAPFGGKLLIYGDFGIPSGIGCTGTRIDWYQVKISKYNAAGTAITQTINFLDPLSKIKTVVQTAPTLKVTNTTEKLGPFTGVDNVVPTTEYAGVYKVNRNTVIGANSTFYSFPDLRINWNTGNEGLYEISLEYFQEIPGGTPDRPRLKKLETGCFVTTPPPGVEPGAVHKLVLKVNNQPLIVRFDHIYLKNNITNLYYQGGGTPDGAVATAYDFNGVGLCTIMDLLSTYKVEVHFTARHEGGYMRDYSLGATSNDGSSVSFESAIFNVPPYNASITWYGTPAAGKSAVNAVNFPRDCGYIFSLYGISRVQNGLYYIQEANPLRTYYVRPN